MPEEVVPPEYIICFYLKWSVHNGAAKAKCIPAHFNIPAKVSVVRMLQCKSGCSSLPVDDGLARRLPSNARSCQLCEQEPACNEFYIMFECPELQCLTCLIYIPELITACMVCTFI